MIEILEDTSRFRNVRKYFTAAIILLVTFAIPVTITQLFKNQTFSTLAASQTAKVNPLADYINPTVIKSATDQLILNIQTKDIWFLLANYWWVGIFFLLILLLWISLVIILIKGRDH